MSRKFTFFAADRSIFLSPAETTTYTLTAINSVGSKTATATVTVAAVNANTIGSFTASPTSIGPGGSSKLSWTATGADRVAISPGAFTSTSTSGSTTVSPTTTTTYTLTAINAAGGEVGTANVTVTVERANGIVVATLLSKKLDAGAQSVTWTGRPGSGYRVRVVAANSICKATLLSPLTSRRS